ncbi:histidine kinase, partial [Bacillus safensis]|nr:histidine kinase [Bacillus safensis]
MNAFYLGFRIYVLIWLGLAFHTAAEAFLPLSSIVLWILTFCTMCVYTFFMYKRFLPHTSGYVMLGAFILITCAGFLLFLTQENGLSCLFALTS